MKIFNMENGRMVAYVQQCDMNNIMHLGDEVPGAFINDYYSERRSENPNDFYRFTNPSEIAFFKKQDWIIDYKLFRDASKEELHRIISKLEEQFNQKRIEFNNARYGVDRSRIDKECQVLDYEISSIKNIYLHKLANRSMELPIVPDSEGFAFNGPEDFNYCMRASFDPTKVLLYRKDGKPFTEEDEIPESFIRAGLSIAIMQGQDNGYFAGEVEDARTVTDDNKYVVIEFKTKEKKQVPVVNGSSEPVKGFKKLFRILKGNNKINE